MDDLRRRGAGTARPRGGARVHPAVRARSRPPRRRAGPVHLRRRRARPPRRFPRQPERVRRVGQRGARRRLDHPPPSPHDAHGRARRRRRARRDVLHRDVPTPRRRRSSTSRAAATSTGSSAAGEGWRIVAREAVIEWACAADGRRVALQLRNERRRRLGPLGPLLPAPARDRRMSKLFVFARRRADLEPQAFWAGWEAALRELAAAPGVGRALVNRSIPDAQVPGLARLAVRRRRRAVVRGRRRGSRRPRATARGGSGSTRRSPG